VHRRNRIPRMMLVPASRYFLAQFAEPVKQPGVHAFTLLMAAFGNRLRP
jgi:hypothetical protein